MAETEEMVARLSQKLVALEKRYEALRYPAYVVWSALQEMDPCPVCRQRNKCSPLCGVEQLADVL